MGSMPDVSVIFPSNGSVTRCPLSSTGSLGAVPPLLRYYEALRLPGAPAPLACAPLGSSTSWWRRRDLPGSWRTLACMPWPLTPVARQRRACGRLTVSAATRPCCLPPCTKRRPPRHGNFGAPSHGLHARCLRFAAAVTRAPRKTRFRLVGQPCRAGLSPAGFHREVSASVGELHGILLTQAWPGARTGSPKPLSSSRGCGGGGRSRRLPPAVRSDALPALGRLLLAVLALLMVLVVAFVIHRILNPDAGPTTVYSPFYDAGADAAPAPWR